MKNLLLSLLILFGCTFNVFSQYLVNVGTSSTGLPTRATGLYIVHGNTLTVTGATADFLDQNGNVIGFVTFSTPNNLPNQTVYMIVNINGIYGQQYLPFTSYSIRVRTGEPVLALSTGGFLGNGNSGNFITFETGADESFVHPEFEFDLDGANASGNGEFRLVFEEEVQKGTGTILFKSLDNLGEDFVVDVNSPEVSIQTNSAASIPRSTVNINLNNNLISKGLAEYAVRFATGVFIDMSGNETPSNFASGFTVTQNTTDTNPPVINSFSPADDAVNVPVDLGSISINFDEPVKLAANPGSAGTDYFLELRSQSAVVKSYDLNSTDVEFDGSTFILKNVPTLASSSYYSIRYYSFNTHPIVDLVANRLVSFNDNATWNFTTAAPNSAPTDIALSPTSIDENNGINAVIGTLSTTDADDGDTHSYSLVTGIGSTDNGSFNINNDQLRASVSFDFEAKSSYNILVQTDDGNDTFQKQFTITVNNVSETIPDTDPPTIVSFSPANDATGVAVDVGTLTINFNEPVRLESSPGVEGTNYWLELRTGINVAVKDFDLNSADAEFTGSSIILKNVPTLANSTTYNIRYYAGFPNQPIEDLSSNKLASWNTNETWSFTTAASTPSNSAPTDIALSPTSIDENNGINEVVGTLSTTDADAGDTHTYSLVAGEGSTDNGSFNINNDQLRASVAFDFEATSSYNIRVQTNDGNDTFQQQFTITVNDVTETTPDIDPPTIDSFSPADDATNVAVDADLSVTFNEDIFPVLGTSALIRLLDFDTDDVVENFDPESNGDGRISITGNTLTLNPTNDLLPSKQYYLIFNENMLQDAAGNRHAGYNNNTTWNFETAAPADTDPPTIVSFSPADNATGVAVDIGTLSMTLSEDIQSSASGTLRIRSVSTSQIVQEFTIGSSDVTISGNTVTLNNVNPMNFNTSYYIQNFNNLDAIEDLAGNNLVGWNTNDVWNFTVEEATADTDPPTIVSFNPADDATGVALDADLTVTFNEPIQAKDAFVRVRKVSDSRTILAGRPEFETNQFTISGNTMTIHLANHNGQDNPLANTEYYVEIQSGAVADVAGIAFAAGFADNETWSFTTAGGTGDTTPPAIVSFSPADNGTGVALNGNLAVTFNETIQAGTGAVAVRKVSDNSIVISGNATDDTQIFSISGATLSIDLGNYNTNAPEAETAYYVQLFDNAISDAAGNPFANGFSDNATWSFTTGTAPTGGTAPTNISLSNATVLEGTVSDQIIATISGTDAEDDISSFELVFDASSGTAADDFYIVGNTLYSGYNGYDASVKASYDITVRAVDDQGLTFEKDFVIQVTTSDTDPPTIVSFSPADDATNVSINSILTVEFNEPIALAESNQAVAVYRNGQPDYLMANDDSRLSINGSSLSIDLGTLDNSTPYYVWLRDVTDLAGNYYAQNDISGTWNFTTRAPNSAPTGIALSPTSIDENNAVNDIIGTLSTTDADAADTHTYELVAGTGDTDNGSFNIVDDELKAVEVFDFETKSSYSVRVQTDDGKGGTFEESFTITINDVEEKQNQTITFDELTDKIYGDASFTLTASSDSELAVNFELLSGPVSLSGNEVTITGTGTATIRATQGGDDTFNPAEPIDQSFDIAKAGLTVSADDKVMTYGEALPALTYQIEGFVYNDEESDLSTAVEISTTADQNSNVGTYEITVSGATAANYDLSFVAGTLTIEKAAQEITFGPIADVDIDQSSELNLSATTSSSLAVSFEILSGPATLNGNTLSLTGTGQVTIRANQAGNENFEPAEAVTQSFNVTSSSKADQTITFAALDAMTFEDSPFELTATASSDLAVTYTISDETVATIEGSTVTIVGAGTTTITASQEGNADYNPASPISQALVVNKADQEITIESISDQDLEAADFEVVASTTSDLELVYAILSGPATLNGNLISLTGEVGTVEIEVSQEGNANYNAASATVSFEVIEDPCIGFEATATVLENASCNGEVDGSFEVTTTAGTGPFVYSLGNESQDNGLFENQAAGSYEITVTDANGCTATATVEITEPEAIEVTAEISDSNSINGNGSITLTVTGGSGNFTFDWSNGETTANLSDLEIGEYSVIVSDESGCSITESYSIGGVTANSEAFELNIYPNPVIDQVQVVHGAKVNQITLIDLNGKIITQHKTEGEQTQLEMKTLPAGMYFIRLDDGKMKRIIKQ